MDSVKYYNENAAEFFNNTVFADMSGIYNKFLVYLNKGAYILDAGCGSGRDTKYFLEKGFKVTAIDASKEMVKLSSNFTGQQTLKMSFQEMNFENNFDAVWACASLLHVSKKDINGILKKFSKALKENGIIFASFKYGDGEQIRNGRLFNYYKENTLTDLIEELQVYNILEIWKSNDARNERKNEIWLNVILRKTAG